MFKSSPCKDPDKLAGTGGGPLGSAWIFFRRHFPIRSGSRFGPPGLRSNHGGL